jgi:hypothetical protein
MKRIIGFMIAGVVILAIGLAFGFSLHLGNGAVVSAAEGPTIDGQVQPEQDDSSPDGVINPTATLAGVTYYRDLAANEFHLTFASYGPAIYALNIPSGGFSFKLPLALPNGSQVTSITVYVVDNTADNNMNIQFYRVKLSNATQIELASVSTVSLPPSSAVQTVSMTGNPITIIDTVNYAYAIRYAPVITGNLHQMVGVQIGYQNPVVSFMPLVGK